MGDLHRHGGLAHAWAASDDGEVARHEPVAVVVEDWKPCRKAFDLRRRGTNFCCQLPGGDEVLRPPSVEGEQLPYGATDDLRDIGASLVDRRLNDPRSRFD